MQIFENDSKNWVFEIPTYSFREEEQKRRFWNSIASHSMFKRSRVDGQKRTGISCAWTRILSKT